VFKAQSVSCTRGRTPRSSDIRGPKPPDLRTFDPPQDGGLLSTAPQVHIRSALSIQVSLYHHRQTIKHPRLYHKFPGPTHRTTTFVKPKTLLLDGPQNAFRSVSHRCHQHKSGRGQSCRSQKRLRHLPPNLQRRQQPMHRSHNRKHGSC